MSDFTYAGSELDLFATALNWKSYWSLRIRPFVAGSVLEVGAGIGANTPYLVKDGDSGWVCLEPDASLLGRLDSTLRANKCNVSPEAITGTLQDIQASRQFDTILYIDVLEHIEDDRGELESAASHLRPGGRIIVLAPAHQWLFSPFDAEIGHFRRYNRRMMRQISPASLQLERLFYLDSVGLLLSAAIRLLLRQSMPTQSQLRVWDRFVIPTSRMLDQCLFNSVGKSIVGILRRQSHGSGHR